MINPSAQLEAILNSLRDNVNDTKMETLAHRKLISNLYYLEQAIERVKELEVA